MARTACLQLLVILASVRAHAAAPTATVARMPKAPTIDGKIAPGEWDVAVRTTGFQGIAQHTRGHRPAPHENRLATLKCRTRVRLLQEAVELRGHQRQMRNL